MIVMAFALMFNRSLKYLWLVFVASENHGFSPNSQAAEYKTWFGLDALSVMLTGMESFLECFKSIVLTLPGASLSAEFPKILIMTT